MRKYLNKSLSYVTSNPFREIKSIVYINRYASMRQVVFKKPLRVIEKGWVKRCNEKIELQRIEKKLSKKKDVNVQVELNITPKDETITRSMLRAKSCVREYSQNNVFDMFVTLTFSADYVNRYSLDECMNEMKAWIHRQRNKKYIGRFNYIIIPEYHEDGAIHVHGLFGEYHGDYTVAISKKTNLPMFYKGSQVYNLSEWEYGWSTMTIIRDRAKASSYIIKYMTKDTVYLFGKHKYLCSKNLQKAERLYNVTIDGSDEIKGRENRFCKIVHI